MKITDVRVLGNPEKMQSWTLVEVTTDEGINGVGMSLTPASVMHALISCSASGLRRLLLGQDARDANRLFDVCVRKWQAERGRGGEGGLLVNAAGAIEQALWDILGKSLGQPIHRLMGGALCDSLEVYASASAFNERVWKREKRLIHKEGAQLIEMAKCFADAGFRSFKFGWGNRFSEADYEVLQEIRRLIGPDIRFMLDFGCPAYLNRDWTVKQAIRTCERLAECGLDFIEEPMHPRDFEGFALLTRESPISIATGESLTELHEFYRLIDERAVDIVQPDVVQLGISRFWKIAQRAADAGIRCVPHGPWSGMAVSAHVQILATIGVESLVEYPSHFTYKTRSNIDDIISFMHHDLIDTPVVVEDGRALVPQGPGLGLGNWVHDKVEAFEEIINNP